MKFFTKLLGIMVALGTAISTYQPAQAASITPAFVAPLFVGEGVTVNDQRRRFNRRARNRRFRGRRFRNRRRNRRGAAIGLGILGGAIIGSAIARDRARRRYYDDDYYEEPRRVRRSGGRAHRRWCRNRYRSYRARSNTFVTYGGRVRRCRSPYG